MPRSSIIMPAGNVSIKKVFLMGSFWSLAGYGLGQVMRLGGNLVLTRLLFPEAFGLTALLTVFIQGLEMLSDLGIRAGIIHHPRGEERDFLDTAWTIQVIRGLGLWVIAALLAWPLSIFYRQPGLIWYLPVSALSLVLSGFRWTALYRANRNLAVFRTTIVELCSQAAALAVMIGWALIHPTIWALVAAGPVSAAVRSGLSFVLFERRRPSFLIEPTIRRDLVLFGRWIAVSTALTFLSAQGDRLVLGRFLEIGQLGVYSIGAFLAGSILLAVSAVSQSVLFPLYSRLLEVSERELARRIIKVRAVIAGLSLPAACACVVWGKEIIGLLYDARYAEAGWILQILSAGSILQIINLTVSPVLLARGDSFRATAFLLARTLFLVAGMAVGGGLAGLRGLVIGISASGLLAYPFLIPAIRRYGVYSWRFDAAAAGAAAVLIAVGFAVKGIIG